MIRDPRSPGFNPVSPIRTGGANAPGSIEKGVIRKVNAEKGTCEVLTQSGRRVTAYLTGQGGGGVGFASTPMSDTSCLVALFGGESAYLLTVFQVPGRTEETSSSTSYGSPGDISHTLGRGGHLLMSQGGIFDLQVDPWTRLSLIPGTKTIRALTQNLEVDFSPLSSLRVIQDQEEGSQFLELFIGSKFLSREGEVTPDISLTLGDSRTSSRAHSHNNRSPFLFDLGVESRSSVSAETVFRKTSLGIGDLGGVGLQLRTENTQEETFIESRTGSFGEGVEGDLLHETTFGLIYGEEALIQVEESGRVTIQTPIWKITAGPDGRLDLENQDTSIVIDGEDIYVGGEEGTQKMALGESLLQRIENIESFMRNHVHLHPHGPTTRVLTPVISRPDFLSSHNHTN